VPRPARSILQMAAHPTLARRRGLNGPLPNHLEAEPSRNAPADQVLPVVVDLDVGRARESEPEGCERLGGIGREATTGELGCTQ